MGQPTTGGAGLGPILALGLSGAALLPSCQTATIPAQEGASPAPAAKSLQPGAGSTPDAASARKCRLTVANLLELRSLLGKRDYDGLEGRLTAIQAENERDPPRELEPVVAFSTFEVSDPQLRAPLDEWAEAHPGSYAAHAARGLYYARQGWLIRGYKFRSRTPSRQFIRMKEPFAVARAALKQAQSLNPRVMVVHATLIEIAMALGDEKAMDDQLAAALRANPLTLAARSTYLVGLQPKWGGSVQAMQEFAVGAQRYADQNPLLTSLNGYVESLVLGPEAFAREEYQAALGHHNAALAYRDDIALFLIPRAETLNALGRYPEAIADCTRVLEVLPNDLMARRCRAEALYATRQVPRALEDLAAGLAFDFTDEDLLTYRAWMNMQTQRYDESLADYERALTVRPNSPSLWAGKGWLLIDHLGRLKEGEAACKKALALDEEEGNAWFCQGLALAQRGSPDARKSFDRALALRTGPFLYTDLAHRLLQGRGVPMDASEAARLFEKAAGMGDRIAQSNLGVLYMNGQGVPKDYEKARRWLKAAAEGGESSAMGNLAFLYAMAVGVPRDYEKAAHWTRLSIAAGAVHARTNYGVMFWYGHGRPRDLVMAYRWIKSAELMGDAEAKKKLEELLPAMTPEQIKEGDRLVQQDAPP
jgi:tetratricopeptide (TPR) repeat protein